MLADQGKVNAAMMASHAQMQAKMSELARAQRAQDKPLTQPAPPAPATEIFMYYDIRLRSATTTRNREHSPAMSHKYLQTRNHRDINKWHSASQRVLTRHES
jgi:hypothetical protein